MAFKVQDAFQYGGIYGTNDKFVSGKREAYLISQVGNPEQLYQVQFLTLQQV
ncbi:MAG: hypothetical protein CM15mV80_210 [uncultured marine virus]|nr:MAG: hypothetical protein CM15mV80_210 [uncultured marine virus]